MLIRSQEAAAWAQEVKGVFLFHLGIQKAQTRNEIGEEVRQECSHQK